MTFKKTVMRSEISFEIPEKQFRQILDYESASYGSGFDLPAISTVLDQIDGVSNTDYNGHYGCHVFAGFETDDEGRIPQIAEFESTLEDMLVDVRRIGAIFPGLYARPRKDFLDLRLEDNGKERAFRRFLYSDDTVLISDNGRDGECTIFFRVGSETRWVDRHLPARIADLLAMDRHARQGRGVRAKLVSMTKDIPSISEWANKALPVEARLQMAYVGTHFLEEHLPSGRPVHVDPRFVVTDCGVGTGLAVTFMTDGEVGTIWLDGGAREQALELLSKEGFLAGRAATSFFLRKLPDRLDTEEADAPSPR